MSKTLLAINILDSVKAEIYGSHVQEWFRLGRTTTDDFILFYPNRFSIDNARNQAAAFALRHNCDYLYFLDDDIILTPNTYSSLKKHLIMYSADIVQALTFIRGYPFHPMMFKRKTVISPSGPSLTELDYFNDYKEFIDEHGCVECTAVGFSCVLIDCKSLLKINPPYFVTSAMTTEDVYFCMKLRDKLTKSYSAVKFIVDTNVPTAHILAPESISVYNREQLVKYYDQLDLQKAENDRGEVYKDQCQKQFNLSAS